MIELFFVLGSVIWFAREAKSIGKNKVLWGFIAVVSFYVPAAIFGLIIYPIIIHAYLNPSNEGLFVFLGIFLNIIVGGSSLLLVRSRLLKKSIQFDIEQQKTIKEKQDKRVTLNEINDYDKIKWQRAYNIENNKFVGKILKLDLENKKCTVVNDYNNEIQFAFKEVLVNPIN